MTFFIGKHILQGRDDGLLEGRILPLGPPISDLRHPGAAEMLLQGLIVTLVGREEGEKVFDTSFAQSGSEVIDGLFAQVSSEDHCDDADGYI